jgi:hypothetical protein
MLPTRREMLAQCAGVAAMAAGWRGALAQAAPTRVEPSATPEEDALDAAWREIHDREPNGVAGLSDHATMGAEALGALGLSGEIAKWLARSRGARGSIPTPSRRIEKEKWRAALGDIGRFGDWRVLFDEELKEAGWKDALDRWVLRLAPGLCAAATHGAIRTGHAARALGRRESKERKDELARGLAYWAAAYQELPAREDKDAKGARVATFEAALEKLPLFTVACGAAPAGNIVNGLASAGRLEGFADARDAVAPAQDVGEELSELTTTFARVYLRHGTRHHTIAFLHAVTGPCALRKIAPHVKEATARAAFPYAWQAAAGIYAAYADPRNDPPLPDPATSEAKEQAAAADSERAALLTSLPARALENGDVHAIKFTEVLLAEHALSPDPAYLAAAKDVVTRL